MWGVAEAVLEEKRDIIKQQERLVGCGGAHPHTLDSGEQGRDTACLGMDYPRLSPELWPSAEHICQLREA